MPATRLLKTVLVWFLQDIVLLRLASQYKRYLDAVLARPQLTVNARGTDETLNIFIERLLKEAIMIQLAATSTLL